MDKFHEQLLRTRKSGIYRLLDILSILSIIFVFLFVFRSATVGIPMLIFALFFVIMIFVLRYLRDRQYKEFEYIFTNGNLQIDVIYNKKKRKTLFDVDIKNFEEFGKAMDIKPGNGVKVVNCVPWDNNDEKYVFITYMNGKKMVKIAPNEDMLKLINIYNVRRPKL